MRASRENAKPSFIRRVVACLVSAAMVVAFTPVVAWGVERDPSFEPVGTAGANNTEGCASLVDGNSSTKWCVTSFSGAYIIFKTSSAINVSGYSITTGNDNATNKGRNPKNWTLYGSNEENPGKDSTSWTVIHTVTNDTILQDVNNTTYGYGFDKTNTAYQYFKLEITEVQSGKVMQMSEFALFDCDHELGEPVVTPPTCTTAGSTSRTCGSCGLTMVYDQELPLGHILSESGTCARPGCGAAIQLAEWSGTEGSPGWYVATGEVTIGSVEAQQNVTVTGPVNLVLADDCTLTVNGSITGAHSSGSSLTVYGQTRGTGELHVTNTITGGTGKGVEGGDGNGGNITINGGMVEAATISGGNGSHSPEGNCGNGGNVTINGGAVTATGSISGGTGGSSESARGTGGDVIISGGMVEAATISGGNGGSNAFGPGPSGSFKTQEENSSSGNAVIFASSISNQSGKDNGTWSGVIFEKNDGKVYGSSVTPTESFTVPSGATLTILESTALAIASGKTLTNNGTIYVDGALTGEVEGNGAVYYPLSVTGGSAADTNTSTLGDKTYGKAGSKITLAAGTAPAGKEFGGWATTPANITVSGGTFTMPNQATEVAAQWRDIYVPPSDPSYNVPAAGEGGVAVRVTVSGSTAVVAEISASALESAAGSGVATIVIDLSGLPKGVTQAQLSKSTVDKLLDVVNDEGNAVESVTVDLGGAVLTLDAKALAAVAGQAKGTNVTLGVKEGSADSLNSAQQKALSPFEVVQLYFEAQIKSGDVEIHDFGGGTVRVSVAFEPRPGHNPARYVVLYVGEDGSIERYATAWAAGMLSFTAPHFSAYAVVYVEDATQAAIDALAAVPEAGELKVADAKEAVKKAEAALAQVAALNDGQKMPVDEALIANAQEVVAKGAELIADADAKAVGKVKNKAFSVKAGKSKSIAFKTKVSAAGTKVVYKKTSGSKYISVTKSGKVTAKKGMKKGKTYTAKVKVTCGKSYKTVAITVRAK